MGPRAGALAAAPLWKLRAGGLGQDSAGVEDSEFQLSTTRSLKGRIARDFLPALLMPFIRILTLPCSDRTRMLVYFDFLRARARRKTPHQVIPGTDKLQLGSGPRPVPGFLNIDVTSSDLDVDLASGRLPFPDASFVVAVSQHVIEHLELHSELLPLLRDVHRVLKPGGEFWVSCPDMKTACRFYVDGKIQLLIDDRRARWPGYSLDGTPPQQFLNDLFHQHGEHQNLLDFELLTWALQEAGFADVQQKTEADLVGRFADFPKRNDDLQTLLVRAHKK
jgi:predicted SAM-dependent methyltransferase